VVCGPSLNVWFEVKGTLPTARAKNLCDCLADETEQRVAMAYGEPGLETLVGCFSPHWDGLGIQTLPEFLMQWLPPDNVMRAIETAQPARFEFGQTPQVLPFVKRA
jgi:hypothetical protein